MAIKVNYLIIRIAYRRTLPALETTIKLVGKENMKKISLYLGVYKNAV
jgi:hypothetical protein